MACARRALAPAPVPPALAAHSRPLRTLHVCMRAALLGYRRMYSIAAWPKGIHVHYIFVHIVDQ